jgi:hypothetical protein
LFACAAENVAKPLAGIGSVRRPRRKASGTVSEKVEIVEMRKVHRLIVEQIVSKAARPKIAKARKRVRRCS